MTLRFNRLLVTDTQQQVAASRRLLRDKAAQRRLALRVCRAWHESSRVEVPVPGL